MYSMGKGKRKVLIIILKGSLNVAVKSKDWWNSVRISTKEPLKTITFKEKDLSQLLKADTLAIFWMVYNTATDSSTGKTVVNTEGIIEEGWKMAMANILTQRIIAFAAGYGAKEDSKEMDSMCSHGAHLTKLSGKKIKYPPLNDLSEFYHQIQSIN